MRKILTQWLLLTIFLLNIAIFSWFGFFFLCSNYMLIFHRISFSCETLFHVFGKKSQTFVWIVCGIFKNIPTPLLTVPWTRRVCVRAAANRPQQRSATSLGCKWPSWLYLLWLFTPTHASVFFPDVQSPVCFRKSENAWINRIALAARTEAACVQYSQC